MTKQHTTWLKKPAKEDYGNALNYLTLVCAQSKAAKIVKALRKAEIIERQAKDLLRASALPLLPRENPRVDEDLKKIHKGESLSPILLVCGDMAKNRPLMVADGYHRICAIYYYDESAPIPCRMIDLPG
jgi:hypothetical protein